jgi:anti-sigma factor RsiW
MSARELTCSELVELVTDYLEDRLAPAERVRFEAHLEICEGCRAYLDQMRATVRAVGRLSEPGFEDVRAELLRTFRDWHGEQR